MPEKLISNIRKQMQLNKLVNLFFLILIILYTTCAIVVSLHRYWQYDAFHYDLGIYDAAIWKVSRFKPPIIDHLLIGGKWNFADHFTPSIFLFSPFYWVTDKTEMLMISQSLCVGLGLLFGYLAAKKTIKNQLMILALILAFMGYIGLQNAIISNFHPIVAAIFPLMLGYWAAINKKWKIWWLALIIMLGFQEDMFIIGCGLGIYLFLKSIKTRQKGIIAFLLSLTYGLLVIYIVIPFFSGGQFLYSFSLKRPILSWITEFFLPVEKLQTMFVSFATFGFLPFFNLPILLTILGTFYTRFVLIGGRDGLGLHYNALIAPLMFIASVETVRRIEKNKLKKILNLYSLVIIFIVVVFHQIIFHGALGLFIRSEFYANTKRQKFLNDFIRMVPTDGTVMTQNHLTLRFIHNHDQVFLLRTQYWLYQPKYIVIELRSGQNPNNYWPMNEEAVKEMVEYLKHDKNYQLIYKLNEQYIFKKI